MPTKNSKAFGIRVMNDTLVLIEERAQRKHITVNAWMNWAIKNGLRNHSKKNGDIMSGEQI